MTLQNRVQPDGQIIAHAARGTFMGNRGGRIHDPRSRTLLPTRRWSSCAWITCVLEFKNRQRQVMGNSYTELFFLDEVTALSAGHRPCYECRRTDAKAFATCVERGLGLDKTPKPPEIDQLLHGERLEGPARKLCFEKWKQLPDGVMCRIDDQFIAKKDGRGLVWQFSGYQDGMSPGQEAVVECLTPPLIVSALREGFQPRWHESAG